MTMREKIALELWHRWSPGHHEDWESEPHKAEYLLAADAVLAALYDPTGAMIAAITPQRSTDGCENYQDMIAAAMEGA